MKNIYFIASISIILTSCLKETPLKKPFSSYTPTPMSDGWQIKAPQQVQIDESELSEIYENIHSDNDLWQIRSLLIFRNNSLVAESYMKTDNDRTEKQAVWSCTKQVLAELVGIAIDKGLISSIDDSIGKYLSNEMQNHADKKNITIRNLLQMQSGIAYSNSGLSGQTANIQQQKPNDILEYILSLPMNAKPNEVFHYNDGNPQIIAAILENVTKKDLNEWATEEFFNKLNIQNLSWSKYKDGNTFGAFGILTTPRELAKFSQCALDSGKWNGNQIINPNWINEMKSVKVLDATPKPFGLFWWIDNERQIFYMDGHGGQFVFANPAKNLMVVMTSEPNTQDEFQLSLNKGLEIYDRINSISN